MRNMGGLLRKMPRTGWTFIIGGLALAGFPIITAGFWSKDEILADAWINNHRVVFFVLALAALLTAFYTARQITMTFLGKPRTAAATHASEHDSIYRWMTIPLMVLAVFAIAFGWLGIPTSFPILGQLSPELIFHQMGSLAEALAIEATELPFAWPPLLTSLVVALGGLLLGWLVYRGISAIGMKADDPAWSPLQIVDPLAKRLGRIYRVLQNKYYFDELYTKVFVKGTQRLSNWLYRFDNLWVIDPTVNAVGKLTRRISEIGQVFDVRVVDGIVNGIGTVTTAVGGAMRVIQTGRVQNYLLVMLVTVSVLLAAFLLLPK
jgi:NADH-quinone oxidoreductase subunit L